MTVRTGRQSEIISGSEINQQKRYDCRRCENKKIFIELFRQKIITCENSRKENCCRQHRNFIGAFNGEYKQTDSCHETFTNIVFIFMQKSGKQSCKEYHHYIRQLVNHSGCKPEQSQLRCRNSKNKKIAK